VHALEDIYACARRNARLSERTDAVVAR
jgi:hypothetical protein